jgi:NTP pyrophosphatase (non-canonical NTP hydrolase)
MTHEELVKALVKPAEQLQKEITPACLNLIHMIMGVSGETGELLDAIKKHVIYRKPLNMPNIIEELGDIEFYLEGLRQQLGVSREQCLQHNIAKLTKRYESGSFSNDSAINRADKQ